MLDLLISQTALRQFIDISANPAKIAFLRPTGGGIKIRGDRTITLPYLKSRVRAANGGRSRHSHCEVNALHNRRDQAHRQMKSARQSPLPGEPLYYISTRTSRREFKITAWLAAGFFALDECI